MIYLLIDSLLAKCPRCEIMQHQIAMLENESWYTTISFGDVLTIFCTLLGLGIAIWQYRKSAKEARRQSQRNQRETWFLQVIVLPQLEKINEFYIKILEKLEEDKIKVQSLVEEKNHINYLNEMAGFQEHRKDEINTFFDHISALVKSYDKELGKKVDNVIMELEDIYVRILDNYGNGQDVRERETILDNKEKLISILNSGMAEKS